MSNEGWRANGNHDAENDNNDDSSCLNLSESDVMDVIVATSGTFKKSDKNIYVVINKEWLSKTRERESSRMWWKTRPINTLMDTRMCRCQQIQQQIKLKRLR